MFWVVSCWDASCALYCWLGFEMVRLECMDVHACHEEHQIQSLHWYRLWHSAGGLRQTSWGCYVDASSPCGTVCPLCHGDFIVWIASFVREQCVSVYPIAVCARACYAKARNGSWWFTVQTCPSSCFLHCAFVSFVNDNGWQALYDPQENLIARADTGTTVKSGKPNMSKALANNAERHYFLCVYCSIKFMPFTVRAICYCSCNFLICKVLFHANMSVLLNVSCLTTDVKWEWQLQLYDVPCSIALSQRPGLRSSNTCEVHAQIASALDQRSVHTGKDRISQWTTGPKAGHP